MEEALVTQLYEDLDGLIKLLITKEPLPPSHVRIIASSILRKWLVNGLINKLSALNHAKFSFLSSDTSEIVEAVKDNSAITFYMAAGVNLNGVPIHSIYASDSPPPAAGGPEIPVKTQIKNLSPADLLRLKRIYFKGRWFSFDEIIRFIANKIGGVHFDTKRDAEWQTVLEEASNYFVAGNPDGLDRMQIIDPYSDKHQMLLVLPKEKGYIRSCLDIELLAAAQAFTHIHIDGEKIINISEA